MKKLKFLLTATILVMLATLTACGGSDPLQGTWRITTYQIEDFEITWEVFEIVIEDNQLTDTLNNYIATFEVSDSGESLVISSGTFQGVMPFEVNGDVLLFNGARWLREGSNEYNEHIAELEERSADALASLIAEEEERIAREEQEAIERLETATAMVEEAETAISDFEEQVARITTELEAEIFEWLEGEWTFNNSRDSSISQNGSRMHFYTETLIFSSGEFSHDVEYRHYRNENLRDEINRNELGYIVFQTNSNLLNTSLLETNEFGSFQDGRMFGLITDVEQAVDSLLYHEDFVRYHEEAVAFLQSEVDRLSSLEVDINTLVESFLLVGRDREVLQIFAINTFGLDYLILERSGFVDGTYNGTREFNRQ